MSVAEWDNEYARLARAASQLRSGVNNNSDANTGNSSLQASLQRLDASLDSLPLQPTEIQRRRRLIQHLQGSSVPDNINNSTTSNSNYDSARSSQMQMAMQQQDTLIDELAAGMGRLKHQSQAIHEEAGMHNRLLSEMEGNLDTAQEGLESETRRAIRLKEDQSVWRLQLTVAGLTILLVMLILLGLS